MSRNRGIRALDANNRASNIVQVRRPNRQIHRPLPRPHQIQENWSAMAATTEPPDLTAKLAATTINTGRRAATLFSAWMRDLVISLAISAFIIVFLSQPVKVE